MNIIIKILLSLFLIGVVIATSVSEISAGDYGVVKNGFPSWAERTVLVWVNRARSDPVADLKDCTVCAEKDCYKNPVPLLTYDYNLNRAARFHSANLISCGGYLQHDSPCTLVSNIGTIYTPGGCDGSASCACKDGKCGCNPDCTSWSSRVSMFGTYPSGENAAYGYSDPVQTFYQWFWEPYSSTECGFTYQNGHRVNILNSSHASIGIGNSQNYWTQDFSPSSFVSRRLYSGTHYPEKGKNIEFRANWADSSAPTLAQVVIDGIEFNMSIERGTPTNGTYIYKSTLPESCHKYYFLFRSQSGTVETFPDEGSYGLNCTEDYYSDRELKDAGGVDIIFEDRERDSETDIIIRDAISDGNGQDRYVISDVIKDSIPDDSVSNDSLFHRDVYPEYVDDVSNGCGCSYLE